MRTWTERDGNRTGYGSYNQPQHSRLTLIATLRCPQCGAAEGELCRRSDGTDRVRVHKERWRAWGYAATR
jgi:hypothetical protein